MIGARRTKVDILKAERVEDGAGGASLAWSVAQTVWASVERLSSTADFLGDRRRRLKRIALGVRTPVSAEPGDRAAAEGAVYEIVSVETDNRDARAAVLIGEEVAEGAAS